MVTALRLMPDKPDPEPEAFAALRGRYQAVVHERDALQTRLDRYETVEQLTLNCDGHGCRSVFAFMGPAPAETQLIKLAISAGWTLSGTKHFCASCGR